MLVMTPSGAQVPLAQLADLQMVTGPSMIRNENGLLAGYVYVDMAGATSAATWSEAKQAVAAAVTLPPGYSLEWSGQYENMLRVRERLKVVVPLTLFTIFFLLYTEHEVGGEGRDRDAGRALLGGGRGLADVGCSATTSRSRPGSA